MSVCTHGTGLGLHCNECEADLEAGRVPNILQLGALLTYKQRIGREWKRCLLDAWTTGEDVGGDDAYLLRQIRNQFGPAWLIAFNENAHRISLV